MKTPLMNTLPVFLMGLVVLFGLPACAGQPTADNGFLSDYSKLEKNPRHEGSRIYVNPRKPLKNYSRFIVIPVQVRLSSLGAQHAPDPAELQKISQYAYQQFVSGLQQAGYDVVTSPGPGTLILRSALTEVAPSTIRTRSVLMNISLGGASIEAEFIDALSGEVVVAVMESQRGQKISGNLSQYENAKNVIDRWAERLVRRMNEEHQKE